MFVTLLFPFLQIYVVCVASLPTTPNLFFERIKTTHKVYMFGKSKVVQGTAQMQSKRGSTITLIQSEPPAEEGAEGELERRLWEELCTCSTGIWAAYYFPFQPNDLI